MTYKDIMGDPWYDMYNELDFEYAKKVRDNPSKYPAAVVDPNNPEVGILRQYELEQDRIQARLPHRPST